MAVLEVNNIEKHFGSTRVLKDVSFSLEKGNALAIIGSSGSGKTTLLRCLNFLETPNQGTIAVNGETIFDASRPVKMSDKGSCAVRDCILAWYFRHFTYFHSIRHWKMSHWLRSSWHRNVRIISRIENRSLRK